MYIFRIFNFCWKFDDLNPVMPKVNENWDKLVTFIYHHKEYLCKKNFFFCYNLMYVFSDWFAKLSTTGKRYSGISLMQLWALH